MITDAHFRSARRKPTSPAGGLVQIGRRRKKWTDSYHRALAVSWSNFLSVTCTTYLAINLLFGIVYSLMPSQLLGVRGHYFPDFVFFSVETFSTVGYGIIAPVGTAAHIVVSIEVLMSMIFTALTTGMVFARFVRTRATIVLSHDLALDTNAKTSVLCGQLINERSNPFLSVSLDMYLTGYVSTSQGACSRIFQAMPLVATYFPVFDNICVFEHRLADHSVATAADLFPPDIAHPEIIVFATGTDSVTGQIVSVLRHYGRDHVLSGVRFADTLTLTSEGQVIMDWTKIGKSISTANVPGQTTPDIENHDLPHLSPHST